MHIKIFFRQILGVPLHIKQYNFIGSRNNWNHSVRIQKCSHWGEIEERTLCNVIELKQTGSSSYIRSDFWKHSLIKRICKRKTNERWILVLFVMQDPTSKIFVTEIVSYTTCFTCHWALIWKEMFNYNFRNYFLKIQFPFIILSTLVKSDNRHNLLLLRNIMREGKNLIISPYLIYWF